LRIFDSLNPFFRFMRLSAASDCSQTDLLPASVAESLAHR
jgi:hypothetical protein